MLQHGVGDVLGSTHDAQRGRPGHGIENGLAVRFVDIAVGRREASARHGGFDEARSHGVDPDPEGPHLVAQPGELDHGRLGHAVAGDPGDGVSMAADAMFTIDPIPVRS